MWPLDSQYTSPHMCLHTKSVRVCSGYPLEILYWNLGLLNYNFFLLVIFTTNLLLCEESVQKHVYFMWWQLCCYSIILKLLFFPQKGSSSYCGYKYAVILIPKVHIPLRDLYLLIPCVQYVKILKGQMSNSKTWRHWHNG